MKSENMMSFQLVFLTIFLGPPIFTNACDQLFEGFGIHLGSIDHFSYSRPKMVPLVVHRIYNDLKIRHFRSSYESTFSPSRDSYEIACGDIPRICSWIDVHEEISKYENTSFMASVWSPPRYMMDLSNNTLPENEEQNFHYFIRNVTALMKTKFNIEVERVSPINEPENIFAEWEHTRMSPHQLCPMVQDFNDSLISVCPESSYFLTSVNFATTSDPTCLQSCEIFGTHAYRLTIGGDNSFRVYYDLVLRERGILGSVPIWQTEVCSTYDNAGDNQMREALDMSINIANYVGHTCIQRYYYWYSYTLNPSGESLMWGDRSDHLILPKKYFAYRHFTLAAYGGSKLVNKYNPQNGVTYLTFGESKVVFVNDYSAAVTANWPNAVSCLPSTFFCTTDFFDWVGSTHSETILPAQSVCSCEIDLN